MSGNLSIVVYPSSKNIETGTRTWEYHEINPGTVACPSSNFRQYNCNTCAQNSVGNLLKKVIRRSHYRGFLYKFITDSHEADFGSPLRWPYRSTAEAGRKCERQGTLLVSPVTDGNQVKAETAARVLNICRDRYHLLNQFQGIAPRENIPEDKSENLLMSLL